MSSFSDGEEDMLCFDVYYKTLVLRCWRATTPKSPIETVHLGRKKGKWNLQVV